MNENTEIVEQGEAQTQDLAQRSGRTEAVAIDRRGLNPTNLDGLWRLAKMVAASGLAPSGLKQPEQICIAMAHGLEIGLPPMQSIQKIAVINGRPTLWGDAMIGLVLASGLLEHQSMRYEGEPFNDDYTAIYECRRKGMADPCVSRYTVADAKRAGLWGKRGPWTEHPNRMLMMRPKAFGLRDTFADVLGGMHMAEEFEPEYDRAPFAPQDMRGVGDALRSALPSAGDDGDAIDPDEPGEQEGASTGIVGPVSDTSDFDVDEIVDMVDTKAKGKQAK